VLTSLILLFFFVQRVNAIAAETALVVQQTNEQREMHAKVLGLNTPKKDIGKFKK